MSIIRKNKWARTGFNPDPWQNFPIRLNDPLNSSRIARHRIVWAVWTGNITVFSLDYCKFKILWKPGTIPVHVFMCRSDPHWNEDEKCENTTQYSVFHMTKHSRTTIIWSNSIFIDSEMKCDDYPSIGWAPCVSFSPYKIFGRTMGNT